MSCLVAFTTSKTDVLEQNTFSQEIASGKSPRTRYTLLTSHLILVVRIQNIQHTDNLSLSLCPIQTFEDKLINLTLSFSFRLFISLFTMILPPTFCLWFLPSRFVSVGSESNATAVNFDSGDAVFFPNYRQVVTIRSQDKAIIIRVAVINI